MGNYAWMFNKSPGPVAPCQSWAVVFLAGWSCLAERLYQHPGHGKRAAQEATSHPFRVRLLPGPLVQRASPGTTASQGLGRGVLGLRLALPALPPSAPHPDQLSLLVWTIWAVSGAARLAPWGL